MSKIGLNVNLGSVGDRSRLIRVLKGMNKTRAHLIMTGGGEPAKERQDVINLINEVGNPNTLYFHRLYMREEGHWRDLTPEKFRPILQTMARHPQIVTEQPTNEPGDADNKAFVDNQLGHLRYAQETNQPIALGTWGVGGAHESVIENGVLDDLYKGIHAANQHKPGSAYLSKHEYGLIHREAGAGFADIPYEVLLEPEKLRHYLKNKTAWDVRKGRWLIRRSDWDAMRCIALGFEPVPMVFSEYGWDGVDNPITYLNHLVFMPGQTPQALIDEFGLHPQATNTGFYDRLLAKYIVPPYNGLRGVGAMRNIAKAIYPELTFAQYVELILKHDNDNILHPKHIVGACLFTWSYNGEWGGTHNTSGHNYGEEGLDDALIAVGQLVDPTPLGTTPTPIPTPTPVPTPIPVPPPPVREMRPVRLQGWDNANGIPVKVNLRASASKTATVLGVLLAAPTVTTGYVAVGEPTPFDGLIWRYVEIDAGQGWLAWAFVRADNAIPVPPPIEPPQPDYKATVIEAINEQIEFYEHGIVQYTHQIFFWRDVKDKLAS